MRPKPHLRSNSGIRLSPQFAELLDDQGFLTESDENAKRLAVLRRRLAPYGVSFDDDGMTSASLGSKQDLCRMRRLSEIRAR